MKETVTPLQKKIWEMRHLQKKSTYKIAKELKMKAGAVTSLLNYTDNKLRSFIEHGKEARELLKQKNFKFFKVEDGDFSVWQYPISLNRSFVITDNEFKKEASDMFPQYDIVIFNNLPSYTSEKLRIEDFIVFCYKVGFITEGMIIKDRCKPLISEKYYKKRLKEEGLTEPEQRKLLTTYSTSHNTPKSIVTW